MWSTYSVDSLVNEQGEVLAVRAGGPALFILRVLERELISFKLRFGQQIGVDILINDKGEFGRVPRQPQRRTINAAHADWAVVSTVLDEWQLVEPLPTMLFVDLQGFVRDGGNFGKKQPSKIIEDLAGKIFCLKGTREEINCLSKSALGIQKKKLLVITDGDKGVELYCRGQKQQIQITKVGGLVDTIGAGDTYLAYFVAAMFRGDTPLVAAKYAAVNTSKFLKTKILKS